MQFYFFTEFGRDQIEHNQINNQFLHKRRLKRGQQSFVFDCAYFGKDPSSYMKINGPLDTSFRHILHTKLFSPSKKIGTRFTSVYQLTSMLHRTVHIIDNSKKLS